MKLKISDMQKLFGSLRSVDADEKTTLDGKTRLAIAININLLKPVVEAYDRATQRGLLAAAGQDGKFDPVKAARHNVDNEVLRDQEEEVALKTFKSDDLRLDDNKRITGDIISGLAPVLEDLA